MRNTSRHGHATLWITLWKHELILIFFKGKGGDGTSVIKGKGRCIERKVGYWKGRSSDVGTKKTQRSTRKLGAVEFEAEQKRFQAEMKAKKEMHEIQTALADSDAKMAALQNYKPQCTLAQLDLSDGDDEDKNEQFEMDNPETL